jgi:O-methyltransferase involved in polyketide biosynthesis
MTAEATEATIEDVADIALWIAAYRARDSARADALFRDPFAARLAGNKGAALAERMTDADQFYWLTSIRTVVIDQLLLEAVARGAGTVLNLGAGLDTRPYRLALPATLRWEPREDVRGEPREDVRDGLRKLPN